jgi:hypothetical protein
LASPAVSKAMRIPLAVSVGMVVKWSSSSGAQAAAE